MNVPVKRCSKCGVVQPVTEFTRDAGQTSGLRPSCKTCQRQYHEANRETIAEHNRQRYWANPEARREASRRYHAAHYDEAKRKAKSEYDREYREANRERLAEQKRRYYGTNRGVVNERVRRWQEANREKAREKARRWRRVNPEKVRENRRRFVTAARDTVLRHYSPSSPPCCACCGATSGHLGIDHIDGDGKVHRKQIQGSFWRWLIREGFPPGYQVLCQSCNSSKGRGKRCRLRH